MSTPIAVDGSPVLRRWHGPFLVLLVPLVNISGGFFTLDFILSGEYTWGRTLRTFTLCLSLAVLAYEFVYRELQSRYPDWTGQRLLNHVLGYAVIPFVSGMGLLLLLLAVTRL